MPLHPEIPEIPAQVAAAAAATAGRKSGEMKNSPMPAEAAALPVRLESLPVDSALDSVVLPYLTQQSVLRLSATSKHWNHTVQTVCRSPWVRIDLTRRRYLTDDALEKLLRRVNAKDVTQTLILLGCKQLKGTGILPLAGSTSIRELDLRFRGGENRCPTVPRTQARRTGTKKAESSQQNSLPNLRAIYTVLVTLSPFVDMESILGQGARSAAAAGRLFGLRTLRLDNVSSTESSILERKQCAQTIGRVLCSFEVAKINRLKMILQQWPVCSCCNENVTGEKRDDNHKIELADVLKLICHGCDKMTCGQETCLLNCRACDTSKCKLCCLAPNSPNYCGENTLTFLLFYFVDLQSIESLNRSNH